MEKQLSFQEADEELVEKVNQEIKYQVECSIRWESGWNWENSDTRCILFNHIKETIEKAEYAREYVARVCGEKHRPLDPLAYFRQYEQLSRQRTEILKGLGISVYGDGGYSAFGLGREKEEQIEKAAKETAQRLVTHYKN
jgi:hypothetical protein